MLPAQAKMWPLQKPYPADRARPAQQRPAVPAELSARKLDGLSLLGCRTGAVSAQLSGGSRPTAAPVADTAATTVPPPPVQPPQSPPPPEDPSRVLPVVTAGVITRSWPASWPPPPQPRGDGPGSTATNSAISQKGRVRPPGWRWRRFRPPSGGQANRPVLCRFSETVLLDGRCSSGSLDGGIGGGGHAPATTAAWSKRRPGRRQRLRLGPRQGKPPAATKAAGQGRGGAGRWNGGGGDWGGGGGVPRGSAKG